MKLSRKYVPTIIILVLLFSVAAGVAGYRWNQANNISVFFEKTMRLTFENDPEQLDIYRPAFREDISRYKSRLTDLSVASANKKSEVAQTQIGELNKFNSASLSPKLQAQYDLMNQHLGYQSKYGEYFPYWFPANPIDGVQIAIPQLFSQHHDLIKKEDCKAFIARLKIIDIKIDQAIKGIEKRKSEGIFPALRLVQSARQQIAKFTSLPTDRNPIYLGFSRKVVRMNPTEMNEYDAASYLGHISSLLEKEIIPAYQRLNISLESLQDDIIAKNPSANKEYFSYRLNYQIGTSVSLDSVFKAGEIESKKIQESLIKGLNEIGLSGSLKNQLNALDQRSQIPSDSIELIVDTYKSLLHDISLKSIGLFEVFDRPLRLDVRVSNLSLNKNRIEFFPEALDGSSKAALLINVSPEEKHSTWRMRSEIYRNGIPGLFVLDAADKYKKMEQDFWKMLQSPSFFQGWSMYADYLLKNDVLLYAEDSEEEMGYFYNNYLLVNGALVDIGINQKGWNIEEAFRFLNEEKGILIQDGWNLVERAASHPGDLTAEWIGANRFFQIRGSVSKRLGDKFFLQEFHDFLILNHPTSWKMLEKQLEIFIKEKLAS